MVFWPNDTSLFLEDNKNDTVDFEMELNQTTTKNVDKVITLKNGTTVHLIAAPPLPKQTNSRWIISIFELNNKIVLLTF